MSCAGIRWLTIWVWYLLRPGKDGWKPGCLSTGVPVVRTELYTVVLIWLWPRRSEEMCIRDRFESTRSFFTNTIIPLQLQKISPEELEKNILEVYTRLYRKYEEDKKLIPAGNLIEIKFEDFEADALAMTEKIYRTLAIPGFKAAKADIAAYLDKKKGYKKNAYKYETRTVELVEKHWDYALKQWDYKLE